MGGKLGPAVWLMPPVRSAHAPCPTPASRRMIVALSEMIHGQEADLFVLMTVKEELTTRDGKPYYKVGFRDHAREVSFPIWHDSPWGADCRELWQPGTFYKLRAVYRETNYGPQLDLRKIRAVCTADRAASGLRMSRSETSSSNC